MPRLFPSRVKLILQGSEPACIPAARAEKKYSPEAGKRRDWLTSPLENSSHPQSAKSSPRLALEDSASARAWIGLVEPERRARRTSFSAASAYFSSSRGERLSTSALLSKPPP